MVMIWKLFDMVNFKSMILFNIVNIIYYDFFNKYYVKNWIVKFK